MHEEEEASPGAPVTLRQDVGRYLLYYVEENKGKFPGIDVQTEFVRRYPDGSLAAHVLGYVGEVERRTARRTALQAASNRANRSARKGSSTPTTAGCAASRG